MAGIIKCPKCGREILSDANFCSFCGIKIEGGIAKSTVQEENTEEYEKEIQKYSDEINELADNYNVLKSEEIKLIKKKQCLKLKVDNYHKLMEGEIPNCEKNEEAPDMAVVENETGIWRIMTIISLGGIIAAFVPWATVYFENSLHGMSLSSMKMLLQVVGDVAFHDKWSESGAVNNMLYLLIGVSILSLCIVGLNIYFLAGVIQKKKEELTYRAIAAGLSSIVLSVSMFLIVLSINSSLNKWLTLRVGPGIWFLGIIGAFLVICACTGRKRKKEKLIYEWDVINFDPVLPIRCNKLKITQEYSLELELTCEEFEWTNVEGIIAEVQMVKNTQNIETLARFVTFSKFRDKKFSAELPDARFDFDDVLTVRVNILKYIISGYSEKEIETGSGYSVLSDYIPEELALIRNSEEDFVICQEKNFIMEYQCSCGQIYAKQLQICPMCGKSRRE